MNEKERKPTVFGGYQASYEGLKNKDGLPLTRKDLKPPKGGSAIVRPKRPTAPDKPAQP